MIIQGNNNKNKHSRIKYEEYLTHSSEPKYSRAQEIDLDLENELLANRFFLKRRVWKNIDKIRQTNARLNAPSRTNDEGGFKQHSHVHVPA